MGRELGLGLLCMRRLPRPRRAGRPHHSPAAKQLRVRAENHVEERVVGDMEVVPDPELVRWSSGTTAHSGELTLFITWKVPRGV